MMDIFYAVALDWGFSNVCKFVIIKDSEKPDGRFLKR